MSNWLIILLVCIVVIVLVALIIFIVLHISKNKKIEESEKHIEETIEKSTSKLADCFGGKHNIESVTQTGSRVSILVKDVSIIDKEAINKELPNVMYMGSKIVLIIGSESEDFKKKLDEKLKSLK